MDGYLTAAKLFNHTQDTIMSSDLKPQLTADMKSAMKAKDKRKPGSYQKGDRGNGESPQNGDRPILGLHALNRGREQERQDSQRNQPGSVLQ